VSSGVFVRALATVLPGKDPAKRAWLSCAAVLGNWLSMPRSRARSGRMPRLGVVVGRLDPPLPCHRGRLELRGPSGTAKAVAGDVVFAGPVRVVRGGRVAFGHLYLTHQYLTSVPHSAASTQTSAEAAGFHRSTAKAASGTAAARAELCRRFSVDLRRPACRTYRKT
jgi:hypothetical protein